MMCQKLWCISLVIVVYTIQLILGSTSLPVVSSTKERELMSWGVMKGTFQAEQKEEAQEICKSMYGSLVKIRPNDLLKMDSLGGEESFWVMCSNESEEESIGRYFISSNKCVSETQSFKGIRAYPLCQAGWEELAIQRTLRDLVKIGKGKQFRNLEVVLRSMKRTIFETKRENFMFNTMRDERLLLDKELWLEQDSRFVPSLSSREIRKRKILLGESDETSAVMREPKTRTYRGDRTLLELKPKELRVYSQYHFGFICVAFLTVVFCIIGFFLEICHLNKARTSLKSQTMEKFLLTKDIWTTCFLHAFHVWISLALLAGSICAMAEILIIYDSHYGANTDILYPWLKWIIDVEFSKYLCPVMMAAFICSVLQRLVFMGYQTSLIAHNYMTDSCGFCDCGSTDVAIGLDQRSFEKVLEIKYMKIAFGCFLVIASVCGCIALYMFDLLGPTTGISIYGLFWIRDNPSLFFKAFVVKFVIIILPSMLVAPVWFYMFVMWLCNPCKLRAISDGDFVQESRRSMAIATFIMIACAAEVVPMIWWDTNGIYNYIIIPIITGTQLLLCLAFSLQTILCPYGYFYQVKKDV